MLLKVITARYSGNMKRLKVERPSVLNEVKGDILRKGV
ncbi:hypothetical protein BTN49_1489 [Candidatus Enterovibrio escicola]|uniref:Uncharacterized protein n=1 Tax=Candidatus Enterovibrio escicola TaxID=1927127 RepID=A0A2A5T460_9GAMM|nr:hypothetical protein BTN49_1489 [Candidatus Enterovibrio escacola]